jgi:transposase
MFALHSSYQYYLYLPATDMRKSFDGLSGLVLDHLNGKAKNQEQVYLFINRRRTMIKVLHYEQGGMVLYYKRLDKGTFSYLRADRIIGNHTRLNWAELVILLQGMSLSKISNIHPQK